MSREQDQIDRLIHAALSVDPAPGLENRIRQRVQREASARRVVMGRLLWPAGLVSAVALVVLMIGLPQREATRVADPATVFAGVNNPPSILPSLPVRPRERSGLVTTATVAVIDVGEPLAKAASSALPAEALPEVELPPFEIRSVSLSALDQGVAE